MGVTQREAPAAVCWVWKVCFGAVLALTDGRVLVVRFALSYTEGGALLQPASLTR